MAWSQTDIDKLKAAMAQGIKRVRYTSGEMEYQSADEMRRVLADMEREVNPDSSPSRRVARFVGGF
jgi:hypothetical protein